MLILMKINLINHEASLYKLNMIKIFIIFDINNLSNFSIINILLINILNENYNNKAYNYYKYLYIVIFII